MTPQQMLAIAARGVAAGLEALVDGYDASPLAVHALAERARGAHLLRAGRAALADPEYAAIQARITEGNSGPGSSEYLTIGWQDFETQLAISSRLTPNPFWWPLASFVADRPVRRLKGHAEAAYARATRGWADSDHWQLDVNLCASLAGQLNHLADSAYGWPGPPDYPEYDDWIAALRSAVAGLQGWAAHEHSPGPKDALAAVELTDEDYRAAADASARDDEVLLAGAQDSLRWVADNLRDLWD